MLNAICKEIWCHRFNIPSIWVVKFQPFRPSVHCRPSAPWTRFRSRPFCSSSERSEVITQNQRSCLANLESARLAWTALVRALLISGFALQSRKKVRWNGCRFQQEIRKNCFAVADSFSCEAFYCVRFMCRANFPRMTSCSCGGSMIRLSSALCNIVSKCTLKVLH